MKRPKIICTLGTTTDSMEVLEDMARYGMSCARLNTAYATMDEYQARIDMLREVSRIPIMMDIKGPQVRLEADRPYQIETGDIAYVGFGDESLHFSKKFYDDVEIGDNVLFENGTIKTRIKSKSGNTLALSVLEPGEGMLHKQMGVNVPGKYLNVQKLSQKDLDVIELAVRNNVEYIALSFARDYEDVANLKNAIEIQKKKYSCKKDIGIIAKIEDRFGIKNLDDIISKSKANGIRLSIMVARGDLYVELPKGELPIAQEQIIRKCREKGIFVITATGILESMQKNSEPSRAEVNDVYTALMQGSNALMLSGETSNGSDPARVVKQLSDLITLYRRRAGR